MTKSYIEALTLNGKIVNIEYPEKHEDDVLDHFNAAVETGGWFYCNRWDGCKAEYIGTSIDRVNCSLVIGTL